MTEEAVVWKGRPSQLLNFWIFLVGGLLIIGAGIAALSMPLLGLLALVPLSFMIWKWLVVRCQIYELTTQRLRLYEGVLNQTINEIELYRVKDTTITRPLVERIFKLGTIHLATSDRTHPSVDMRAIPDGLTVRELIRKHVEHIRDEKRVREVDFESQDADALELDAGPQEEEAP